MLLYQNFKHPTINFYIPIQQVTHIEVLILLFYIFKKKAQLKYLNVSHLILFPFGRSFKAHAKTKVFCINKNQQIIKSKYIKKFSEINFGLFPLKS